MADWKSYKVGDAVWADGQPMIVTGIAGKMEGRPDIYWVKDLDNPGTIPKSAREITPRDPAASKA